MTGCRAWALSAASLLIVGQAASEALDTSKICPADNSAKSELFWASLLKQNPIPIPTKAMTATPSAPADECSLDYMEPKSDASYAYETFDEAMAACGFANAIKLALMTDRTTAAGVAFCAESATTKAYCAPINTIHRAVQAKLKEASLAPDDGSTLEVGTYGLSMASDLLSKDHFNKHRAFLQSISSWERAPGTATSVSLVCGPSKPKPFQVPIPDLLVIGKDASAVTRDAGQPEIKDADVAAMELSLAFDRENRTTTETDENGDPVTQRYDDFVTFNGAIGFDITNQFVTPNPDRATFKNDSILTFVTALEYAEALDPTKETDNFSFSLRAIPQLGWNNSTSPFSNPTIEFGWITDIEERESAQWKAGVTANLFLADRWSFVPSWFPIDWRTDLALDYIHVIDEGDKSSLANVGEVSRMGYDINWFLDDRLFEIGEFAPTLTGSYQYRDVIGSGAGRADLVKVDLGLIPLEDKKGGLGLALSYERGENLTSLEAVEAYKIKLLVRNGLAPKN